MRPHAASKSRSRPDDDRLGAVLTTTASALDPEYRKLPETVPPLDTLLLSNTVEMGAMRLTVKPLKNPDPGSGMAVIDRQALEELAVSRGDFVAIEGPNANRTVARLAHRLDGRRSGDHPESRAMSRISNVRYVASAGLPVGSEIAPICRSIPNVSDCAHRSTTCPSSIRKITMVERVISRPVGSIPISSPS